MAWIEETALPFTPTIGDGASGLIYFSPIIDREVYVIDQGTNFYKYSLATRTWTPLAPPGYTAPYATYRSLALSPDGTKLACCSAGYLQPTGTFKNSGGRRIEIYDIVAGTWSASSIIPNIYDTKKGLARAVVWETDDIIWVWAASSNGSASGYGGKCIKYVPSTDTFTVYSTLSANTYGFERKNFGFSAAIESDGSLVYMSGCKVDHYFITYNVAADDYGVIPSSHPGVPHHDFAFAADRARLWFTNTYAPDTDGRQGYVLVEATAPPDYNREYNQFTENTEKEVGYGIIFGVSSDLAQIIAWAKSTPPELMSEGIVAPTVTTDPATDIESTNATLNGTLDDYGGEACACGFEYGETEAYGNPTPTESKTTGEAFSQDIEGLSPATTYHFRAFATNSQGTSYGADQTFTTPVGVPSLTTEAASAMGLNGATLNGALTSDGGEPCYCGFEWGATTAYGSTTPTQRKVTGEVFSQPLLHLGEAAQYHFRAFATNSAGTAYGEDRTLDTLFRINKAYALARYEV